MAKVVFNRCFGGFSLIREAVLLARELSGNPKWGGATIVGDIYDDGKSCSRDYGYIHDIPRHDPVLVEVVERLGSERASGRLAELAIAELPSGTAYRIDEYDGRETVETKDSYDWIIAP